MTLIDDSTTVSVLVDDSEYHLRRELGFYEASQMQESAFKFEFPSDWSGKDIGKVKAIPNRANSELARLKAYLVRWSHPVELTDENIKRLHPLHANRLLEEIKTLEEQQRQPFAEVTGTSPFPEEENA